MYFFIVLMVFICGLSLCKSHAKVHFSRNSPKSFAVLKIYLPLPPVNQKTKNKMKKVLSLVAVSAMLSLAACGGGEDEAKRKADSTKAAAKAKADSTRMADSMANVEMARKADSARVADSIANAKPTGGKPKTIEQKVKEEATKATKGRG
jgi:hypothetical protein